MPVVQGVVDSLVSPEFATLQYVLDEAGPFPTGDYTRDHFTTSGAFLLPAGDYDIGGTYGAIVAVAGAIPPSAGLRFGWQDALTFPWGDVYDPRICQIVLQHFLPIPARYVTTLMQDCASLDTLITWPVLIGSGARVGLHVEPGWSVDLYFMCVL